MEDVLQNGEIGRDFSHSIHHVRIDYDQIKKELMLDSEKGQSTVSLQVRDLKYGSQNKSFLDTKAFFERNYEIFKYLPYNYFLRRVKSNYAKLNNINFSVAPGKMTAVIGPNEAEITTLFDMMGGRRKRGEFNGDICINGLRAADAQYIDNIAYCRDKYVTYSPGLTYRDTLLYSAFMLLPDKPRKFIEKRVDVVLKIMGLSYCKNRVIPENHSTKGEAGRDLRLLCIACEIVAMPPVIIIKNPSLDLHISLATTIYECLHIIAKLGHVVICSIPKPNHAVARFFDDIVVIREGYSIYSGPSDKALDFFSSVKMGYKKVDNVDTFEWVLDIARGVERPETKREVDSASLMQINFVESELHVPSSKMENSVSIFQGSLFQYYGYVTELPIFQPKKFFYAYLTVIERAALLKFKDRDSFRRHFMSSIVLALVIGYLQYKQGQFGYYLQNFFMIPFANTSNFTALCFFVCIFTFVQQGLNMHCICQKLQIFRHEQKSHKCSAFAFALGTFLVEILFSMLFSWLFATIIYFMADLGKGVENYWFFVRVVIHMAACGIVTALNYGALFQKEILARDFFLLTVFLMIMNSGFPFQLSIMSAEMENLSEYNPARWGFQCLLIWKTHLAYIDPQTYLNPFGFGTTNKALGIDHLDNFVIALSLVYYAINFPGPMLLSRMRGISSSNDNYNNTSSNNNTSANKSASPHATDFNDNDARTIKKSKSIAPVPVIFSREAAATQNGGLITRKSFIYNNDAEMNNVGPVVTFEDLTYCIKDPTAPGGCKVVLNKINGQFGYGKMSLITGSFGSGKTSLLHILAGNYKPIDDVSGQIYYNDKKLDQSIPLFQRCSLVEANDEVHRDLTVYDIFWYAAVLRSVGATTKALAHVKIMEMAETLHLKDQLYTKIKLLKSGARRRVAIGEELLNGSNLLFIDEPTSDLEPYEEAVVIGVLRELVNADKTVIASVQYPHSNIYSLFDVVLALAKGRVIYQGNGTDVAKYFIESPYQYDFSTYNSPGEFLVDIAGGFIKDCQGIQQIPDSLEGYFKKTKKFEQILQRVEDVKKKVDGNIVATGNPLFSGSSLNRSSLSVGTKDDLKRESIAPVAHTMYERHLLQLFISYNIVPFFTWKSGDFCYMMSRSYTLVERECFSIASRKTLLFGSIIISLFLGLLFGVVMGKSDSFDQFYNNVSFYAVSCLLLLLSSVQYISYLYRRDLIFLKEHSRGLYTNFTNWMSVSWPLYILRIFNAIGFSLVAYGMTKIAALDSQKFSYFLGNCIVYLIAGLIMVELVVHMASDVRKCYFVVPGLIFFQFTFSGLFVKASSLPHWLGSWVTSVSMIRWSFQGNFINQFKGEDLAGLPDANFPPPSAANPNPTVIFNIYDGFLQLFGWVGKTKEYCVGMLFVFIIVLKSAQLFVSGIDTVGRRCGRESKSPLEDS